MVAHCVGRGEPNGDHCCYINNKPCPFLQLGTPESGRRWVCGLREELGSWEAVHADSRYKTAVQPAWDKIGIKSCGDWQPGPNICCNKER